MSTRFAISFVIYGMVQAVLFGIGLLAVVYTPALKANAVITIPVVILLSLGLAIPISWKIAPRMRSRHQRDIAHRRHIADA